MELEKIYLVSIWAIQLIIYGLLSFKLLHYKIKKLVVFFTAVSLFLIAPWIFPAETGINPETGEYTCGLAALVPIAIFWIIGNVGNILLLIVFLILDYLKAD